MKINLKAKWFIILNFIVYSVLISLIIFFNRNILRGYGANLIINCVCIFSFIAIVLWVMSLKIRCNGEKSKCIKTIFILLFVFTLMVNGVINKEYYHSGIARVALFRAHEYYKENDEEAYKKVYDGIKEYYESPVNFSDYMGKEYYYPVTSCYIMLFVYIFLLNEMSEKKFFINNDDKK